MSYRLTPRVQLRSSPATFSKAFSVYRGEPPRPMVAMAAEDITRLTILSLSMSTTVSPLSMSMEIPAYGATAAKAPLEPLKIERRKPGQHDVEIEILYCGICHSDVHKVNDDWGGTHFPVVPGHEIVGRVASRGTSATRFREGELVGVGCLVESCGFNGCGCHGAQHVSRQRERRLSAGCEAFLRHEGARSAGCASRQVQPHHGHGQRAARPEQTADFPAEFRHHGACRIAPFRCPARRVYARPRQQAYRGL